MLCIKCHKENPDGLKFCIVCGQDLDDGLYGFLASNGLGEHLELLRSNDLVSLADLLRLEEADLRELKLPYGDIVRLRTAINALRQRQNPLTADEQTQSVATPSPAIPLPAVTAAAHPATSAPKSAVGKIVASVLGAAGVLVLLAKLGGPAGPNKSEDESSRPPELNASVNPSPAMAVKAPLPSAALANNRAAPSLRAFNNSFGHRMIPIPGTDVLFSVWPVRVSDYRQFANETGTPWKEAGFPQAPSHPAVRVNHHNAKAFCRWLTDRERQAGILPAGYEYRLPRDLEWSTAAGLRENPEGPPAWRSGAIPDCFPWGTSWPPPYGSGNYDSRLRADSFPYTSPVGSFAPNKFGLYDMSGNVFEWIEEDFDESGLGCLRGGSWPDESPVNLNLSTRCQDNKTTAHKCYGFRYVLAPVSQ